MKLKLFGVLLSLVVVGLAGAGTGVAAEVRWHEVARVDGARPAAEGFVLSATPYRYSAGEIPAAALPADAPERSVLFSGTMRFCFDGLKPGAKYQVRAAFLSDSDNRAQRVSAGDVVLAERLVLPRHQVLRRTWDVPASQINGGELTIAMACLSGPNAVVSSLEVWSTDPARLKAPPSLPERLAQMSVPLPRLSPRPLEVAGTGKPSLSLDGEWKFAPAAPEDPAALSAATTAKWKRLQVPGEWVMQGFTVEKDKYACYYREFKVPAAWAGNRLKLRFDSVHSQCRVWVNGKEAGGHEGGFVPFELDITEGARPGANSLAVAVKNESVADVLASATQYAGHPLGGITRKVTLFAVPPVNLAAQALVTEFDAKFQDATLKVQLEVANESNADVSGAELLLELRSPEKQLVALQPEKVALPLLRAHRTLRKEISLPVTQPRQWDTEHPNLYTLRTELRTGARSGMAISQRFGFRQVEVRSNQVFVNNRPIKLHGVCRHETHPLLGRSLTPELWRKDAEMFRAANVNYIRTSHYPPAEEFLERCDELGLFVECEAPLCWVQHGGNAMWGKWDYQDTKFFPYLLRVNLESVVFNRNHPSIIIWSLANESHWSPLFAEVQRRVKALDPSRPTSFHDQCWGNYNDGGSKADIAVYHYPGTNGPAKCDEGTRPTLFGEYCHVQTYNHREHFTDPGVRDQWGPRFGEMYDLMYRHQGCLGGAIWSGVDDAFHLPDGQVEGYGFWGVIDGWRRAKPETFHVRKAYSPIRVTTSELACDQGKLSVALENRYDFTDLKEVRIGWRLGKEKGNVVASLPARSSGQFIIRPQRMPVEGQKLHLTFTDPRGFVCEEVELPVGQAKPVLPAAKPLAAAALQLETNAGAFEVKGKVFSCEVDRQTGQFTRVLVAGKPVLVGGPTLMLLPLDGGPCKPQDLTQFGPYNELCRDWRARSVSASQAPDGSVRVKVEGEYAEAAGSYSLRIGPEGSLELTYDFAARNAVNPRQVGMIFWLARGCDTLRWERRAEWSVYPAEHPGRPLGEAKANPNGANHVVHLSAAPKQAWSADTTALGTADFRSSKSRVLQASLQNAQGRGLSLSSDGTQTARAFVAGERIGWLIACINAGGGEGFFGTHHAADRRPLKKGAHVSDTVRLQLINR